MGKTSFNRLNHKIKSWRIGDYFRQFSIVAAGIIVTFWGNDRITENARQKEVRATMQLITEELEYNKQELRNIKHLLDIDIHMSLLLKEHDMDVSKIPTDTLWKYGKLFNNMDEFSYRTDALDVLKGSSLMQYIPDKRMLQDVLQTYFELGRKQRDVGDYYATKTDALMSAAMSRELAHVFDGDDSLRDQALFLVQYKKFINYVNMVPGFLYWHEFDELDERLAKQIQVLKAAFSKMLRLTNKRREEASVKRALTLENEIELIEGCRAGKDSARKELYTLYSKQMLAVCYRYTGDVDAAHDVLHDGFIKIFTHFTFRGECALSTWVTRVMVTQAIDYLRKQQRFSQLVVNEEQLPDIPDEAGIAETGGRISEEMLMAFVAELPDGCRTVFNLYVFEEKSHKEIAEILHIKEHSSTSQLHRAKCLLIKRIKEYTEYERK